VFTPAGGDVEEDVVVDLLGREALRRVRVPPVSATLGRVKDAFR
jgi:hypothetical protein